MRKIPLSSYATEFPWKDLLREDCWFLLQNLSKPQLGPNDLGYDSTRLSQKAANIPPTIVDWVDPISERFHWGFLTGLSFSSKILKKLTLGAFPHKQNEMWIGQAGEEVRQASHCRKTALNRHSSHSNYKQPFVTSGTTQKGAHVWNVCWK